MTEPCSACMADVPRGEFFCARCWKHVPEYVKGAFWQPAALVAAGSATRGEFRAFMAANDAALEAIQQAWAVEDFRRENPGAQGRRRHMLIVQAVPAECCPDCSGLQLGRLGLHARLALNTSPSWPTCPHGFPFGTTCVGRPIPPACCARRMALEAAQRGEADVAEAVPQQAQLGLGLEVAGG